MSATLMNSNDDPYCRMPPNPAKAIACFYCGNGMPWFQCHCFRAEEARDGKRLKPKVIPASKSPNGRTIIVLDEEAIANSWLATQIPRYEKPRSVTQTVTEPPAVTEISVTKARTVTEADVTRVTPMTAAERQRRWRERNKAHGAEGSSGGNGS